MEHEKFQLIGGNFVAIAGGNQNERSISAATPYRLLKKFVADCRIAWLLHLQDRVFLKPISAFSRVVFYPQILVVCHKNTAGDPFRYFHAMGFEKVFEARWYRTY